MADTNKLKKIQQDKSKDDEVVDSDTIDQIIYNGVHRPYNDPLTYYRQCHIDNILPECYQHIKVCKRDFECYVDETLFYMFYVLVNTEAQMSAFKTLINRGYVYSKTIRVFVYHDTKIQVDNKKHVVVIFDPFTWSKMNKEVVFDDKFVNGLER